MAKFNPYDGTVNAKGWAQLMKLCDDGKKHPTKQAPNWMAHHGIEGQRWGVRHGPPYPLEASVSTGKRLKKRTVEEKADRASEARHKGRKIGAIVSGAASGVTSGLAGFMVGGPALGIVNALYGAAAGAISGGITGHLYAHVINDIKERRYESARNKIINDYKKQMDDRNWKYSSEEIKMKMDIAEKDDCYDVGFLRFATPDISNKSSTLKLYSSYLKDPATYDQLLNKMPGMLDVAADASYKSKQTEKKKSYNVDFEEVFDAGGERYLDLENGKMTKDQYNKIKDKEYKKYMKDPSNYADRGYKKGG